MATPADIRFWNQRATDLERKIASEIDRGERPDRATVTAHYTVLRLRSDLQRELGRAQGS